MKPKISLITLGVTDFERSLAFYRDGLGLPLKAPVSEGEFALFALEGTCLALFPFKKLAADAGLAAPPGPMGFAGFTLAHNVGSQADVDELFRSALLIGSKPQKPPQKTFWGGYSAYITDPDGYLWEISYNPFDDLT